MSVPTQRRRLPAGERRAMLLDAAGPLFGEHGYEGTRLDDVAAAAGVTKPILYRHFGSKTGLYLALLERHQADLPAFAAAIPAEGAPIDRLRAVLEVWLNYVESHSYAWRMLFRDSGGGPEVQAHRLEVHAHARAILGEIIRSLSEEPIPRREIEPLAELMSMGMGSLVLWWIEGGSATRQSVIDAIARVWAGLLSGRGLGSS